MICPKKSKTMMFDIKYETFPDSGESHFGEDYYDDYIVGLDEELPTCYHDPAFVDEIEGDVEVTLSPDGWCKVYDQNVEELFADPILTTEDEFDDIELYAKWEQTLVRTEQTFNGPWTNWGYGPWDLTSKVTIFKWDANS